MKRHYAFLALNAFLIGSVLCYKIRSVPKSINGFCAANSTWFLCWFIFAFLLEAIVILRGKRNEDSRS